MVARAAGRRRALAFARQRLLQRMDQQRAHQAGVAEAHLGLGRVHVDVDLARIGSVTNSATTRMAVARQIVGIGAAHRRRCRSLSRTGRPLTKRYWPSELARRSVGSAAKPSIATPSRSRRDLDRIGAELGAEHVAEPRQPPGRAGQRRRPGHRRALLAGEREGDIRPAHGEAAHHLAHGLGLGAVALEEFQPRRRGVEQVAHLDAGALRRARPA